MDKTTQNEIIEKSTDKDGILKPLILQRADPYIIKHNGIYYFTASVPEYDRIELRSSKTLTGLTQAEPIVVWRKHETGKLSEHIWAPEMHFIDNAWYIYFAASEKDNKWELRPYVLKCEGNPMHDKWIELGAVQGIEGDEAFTDFSLDATILEHKNKRYLIWAEKVGKQFGISNLYIAEMASPNRLACKRVLIASPQMQWETIGFYVNEGPFAIKSGGKIHITFSASATGAMYCMGVLYMDENDDPLNPSAWTKIPRPAFTTNPALGIFGPGHNCFTTDDEGNPVCVFHARPYEKIEGDPLYDPNRHTYIMKMQFSKDGFPMFNPLNEAI